ncbi:three-helix bundle dimerization domain-containing protein [Pseudonocardia sp. GCM10023141]|uniref:three-helix bundle dimerization domain-containing protein n=1 Tax=Pseudonocardia sp. GCM10023141 TaxID=3252653 RepID=UPI00361AE1D1
MTSATPDPHPQGTEISDTVVTQLDEVRARLARDGAAHRVEEHTVRQAVDDAAHQFTDAPVRSYIGVLVERAVRTQLAIPSLPT